MNVFKADLHTHTVLSPCGDLEMSAGNIVDTAKERGIDILGITDHNSTLNAKMVKKVADEKGLFVLTGAEVTTREEIHCLCFFEREDELDEFQLWLEMHITRVHNSPEKFGYQIVCDADDNIIDEVEYLLIMALTKTINQVEEKVHELNGLFIPAHVDRPVNSLLSQLGFIPTDINYDAMELSAYISTEEFLMKQQACRKYPLIRSSDSHFLDQVGRISTEFLLKKPLFSEIRLALAGREGREVLRK